MNRYLEKITGIIGIVCFIVIAGLMLLFNALITNDNFQEIMGEEIKNEEINEQFTEEELSGFFEQMEDANYTLDAALLAVLALAGVAALILLKKKAILSALLFLGSAIVATALFWSMILPLVPAILYLISASSILVKHRSKGDHRATL